MSTPEHETITDLRPGDIVTLTRDAVTITAPVVGKATAGWAHLEAVTVDLLGGHFECDLVGSEAWRLVSATRPAPPAPAPGTVGTATFLTGPPLRGMWMTSGAFMLPDERWFPAEQVESFVPDPDTAALRAEVDAARRERDELQGDLATQVQITVDVRAERDQALTDKDMWIRRHNDRVAWAVHEKEEMAAAIIKVAGERNEANARADAAEARLARVTELLDAPGDDVSCAGRDLTTPGCFAHDLAVRIRALVAADEQAAEVEVNQAAPWLYAAGEQILADDFDRGVTPENLPNILDAAPVGTVVRRIRPGDGAEVSARRAKDGWVFLHNDAWILSTAFAKHYAPLTVVSVPGVGGAA